MTNRQGFSDNPETGDNFHVLEYVFQQCDHHPLMMKLFGIVFGGYYCRFEMLFQIIQTTEMLYP